MVEDKAEFSSGGRSNRLIGYLIAIAVVFAVLFGLRALIDLCREAEKKNKKVEDLKLTSVDGEVLPARAKSIPKEGGYVYFLKDNRYFLLEFRQNSRSGYSKYYLELSETLRGH